LVKLSIIHFYPLELYPPVLNLLRTMEDTPGDFKVFVYTTHNHAAGLSNYTSKNSRIRVIRLGTSGSKSPARRYLQYLYFYLTVSAGLIAKGTRKILYYETISALPAWITKLFIRSTQIFVHYHEYTSSGEYRKGPALIRWFHALEQRMYRKAAWVSHTNHFRMNKFVEDVRGAVPLNVTHILPNYPPRTWYKEPEVKTGKPVKMVYAGALSLDTMYTKEFAAWVQAQNGAVVWDIYSFNVTESAKQFLKNQAGKYINLLPGVDYEKLPAILSRYHVGIILYNGHIPNYIYNAPNKLFEYAASGLDVWFPDIMIGSLEHQTKADIYPKILALDFTALQNINLEQQVLRDGLILRRPAFYCDQVLAPLVDELISG
jgi:hypothetical protein